MANVRHPGFYPAQVAVGGGSVTYVRRRPISNNTNAINCQDVVTADSSGDILGQATSGQLATKIDSVAMGVSYVDANGNRIGAKSLPASTTFAGTTFFPVNAPWVNCVENVVNVKFRCSLDAAAALTNLRNNFDINLRAGVNGYSQQDLRFASANTTATLPFRVVEMIEAGDSDPDAADAHCFALANSGFTEPALNNTGT